jgi:hypothetical protein
LFMSNGDMSSNCRGCVLLNLTYSVGTYWLNVKR